MESNIHNDRSDAIYHLWSGWCCTLFLMSQPEMRRPDRNTKHFEGYNDRRDAIKWQGLGQKTPAMFCTLFRMFQREMRSLECPKSDHIQGYSLGTDAASKLQIGVSFQWMKPNDFPSNSLFHSSATISNCKSEKNSFEVDFAKFSPGFHQVFVWPPSSLPPWIVLA